MADGILKVGTLTTSSGSGTVTLGQSGETVVFGSNVTTKFNQPSFRAYRISSQNISDNTQTKVQLDGENFDTDSTYDNSTNYRFTPGVSGKYFVFTQICCTSSVGNTVNAAGVVMKKNGSEIARNTVDPDDSYRHNQTYPYFATIVEMNTTDYIEIFAQIDVSSGTPQIGDGSNQTYFGAYRMGIE